MCNSARRDLNCEIMKKNDRKSLILFGVAMAAGSVCLLLVQSQWGLGETPFPLRYREFLEQQAVLEGLSMSLLMRGGKSGTADVRRQGGEYFAKYYMERGDRAAAESWLRYCGGMGAATELWMSYGDFCAKSADPADWRTGAVCFRRARDEFRQAGKADLAAAADAKLREIQLRRGK